MGKITLAPVSPLLSTEMHLSSEQAVKKWVLLAQGLVFAFVLVGLFPLSRHNYLLYHSLIEIFSVVVALTIFSIGWNSRQFVQNNALLLLAVAYLVVGSLDLLHILGYRGMGVFPGRGSDQSTQLWIAARYVESVSLLGAAILLGSRKPLRPYLLLGGYLLAGIALVFTIVPLRVFPTCYVEGAGLTPFKVASEYVISGLLAATMVLFWYYRRTLSRSILLLLLCSVVATILSELSFTLFVDVYGFFNFLGHAFKLISVLLIYAALVQGSLKTPYRSLFHELATELAERKRAEKALRISHDQYQTLIDISPSGIIECDTTGILTFGNKAYYRILGYNAGELVGKPLWFTLETEAAQDNLKGYIVRLVNEQPPPVPYLTKEVTKGGRTIDVQVDWNYRRDEQGEVIGFVSIITDITERTRAEEMLKETNRELDAFVYTVAHDLRSPLVPIIGYADFLHESCRDRLDEQALGCLAEISASGGKMVALMEDLLTLAKIGYVERPAEPLDTGAVVNEAVCGLAGHITQAGMSVDVGVMPTLRVPKTLLAQIFDNLIGNAVRYAGREGSPIKVGGERRGDLVRFYVRDHGPGIPKEERSRIFEVFYRGTTGKNSPGTGVGLATVQKIARPYGGRAWVEETEGGGSTFWVEMLDVPATP